MSVVGPVWPFASPIEAARLSYQGVVGGGAGSRKCVIHKATSKPSTINPMMSYLSKRAMLHYDMGHAG